MGGAVTRSTVARAFGATAVSVAILLAGPALAQPESEDDAPEPTPLDVLVAEAVTDYPAILAEWAEVEALRTREEQVRQPFDPMLTAGLLNVPWRSFSFSEHAMTGVQVGISERFYWPGTLDARADEARAMAEARQAAIPETVIRIWLAAVGPYYEMVELERDLGVLRARREVVSSLLDAARARYEARAVELDDVLRVQTQLNRIDQDLAAIERRRRMAAAELNGLLNRPVQTPIDVSFGDRPLPAEGDVESWLARAVENRPAFAAFEARDLLVDAQRARAETDDDPIVTLGLAHTFRFQDMDPIGFDLWTLTAGITLPFFSARQVSARLDELEARRLGIEFEQDETIRAIRARIGTHIEGMDSLEDEIAILEGELIPSVEATYESALAHYASSHRSIEPLIEIQDRLLELELARANLVSMHDRQRALLEAVTASSEAIRQIAWSDWNE